jgi:hypothetical protein
MSMDGSIPVSGNVGVSLRSAERTWTYAKAWLRRQIGRGHSIP